LTLVRALLTGSSVYEISSSTSASVSNSKSGSSDTSSTLLWSGSIADRTVKGRTFIALEGFGGVKVESGKACASSFIGIEEKSSLSIAGNTGRRSNCSIKTSISGAASNAASSAGIIGLKVLRKHHVGKETLINSSASNKGYSDNNIGNSGVDVDSLEYLVNSIKDGSVAVNKHLSVSSWCGEGQSIY
jgi:hypothetical protein